MIIFYEILDLRRQDVLRRTMILKIRKSRIPSLDAECFGRVKFHPEMEFSFAIEKRLKK